MPFFKVWSSNRNIKKFVRADTFDDLLAAASFKFAVEGARLVLNDDGTDIEETEVLLEVANSAIIILAAGEQWSPVTSQSQEVQQLHSQPPVQPETEPEPPLVAENLLSNITQYDCSTEPEDLDLFAAVRKVRELALPRFSTLITRHLKEGQPERVWNKLISEAAEYYFAEVPDLKHACQYKAIGEVMYRAWPCIDMGASNAAHPWTFFIKQLSQKLRHMRHSLKRKSQCLNGDISPPCPQRFRTLPPVLSSPNLSVEEMKAHVIQLKEECSKSRRNQNQAHIKRLLHETLEIRNSLLKEHQNGSIKEVIEMFPCLEDSLYILYDFTVRFGNDKLKLIGRNIKRIMIAAEKDLRSSKQQDEYFQALQEHERMVHCVQYLEKQTKYESGKDKFQSILLSKMDCTEEDINTALTTQEGAPLKLVLFSDSSNDSIQNMFIVGDTVSIKCQGSTLISGLLALLSSYYIFDLQYPKCFSMVLALFQCLGFEEKYDGNTSKNFKLFMKSFRSLFAKVSVREE